MSDIYQQREHLIALLARTDELLRDIEETDYPDQDAIHRLRLEIGDTLSEAEDEIDQHR